MSAMWKMLRSRTARVASSGEVSGAGNCERNRSIRAAGTPWVAARCSISPSTTNTAQLKAPHTCTPLQAMASKTGWASVGDVPMTRKISAVAVC